MKKYRRLRSSIALFLGASVVVGIAGAATPRHEIFPLYSWFLFSLVPNQTAGYDLFVRAVDGQPLTPPVSYRRTAGLLANPHSIVTFRAVQELGRAQEPGGDPADFARLRAEVERQFLAGTVRYELVRVTYADPLEHWKTGRPERTERLRELVSSPGPRPPANVPRP